MYRKIEAIIKVEKLDDVKDALQKAGFVGMNAVEVRGHGRQGGLELAGRTGSYRIDMLPRIQLNIVVSEHNVEEAIRVISDAARTGEMGDGLIFVLPVLDVIRIRTGERGKDALHYAGDIDEKRSKK